METFCLQFLRKAQSVRKKAKIIIEEISRGEKHSLKKSIKQNQWMQQISPCVWQFYGQKGNLRMKAIIRNNIKGRCDLLTKKSKTQLTHKF